PPAFRLTGSGDAGEPRHQLAERHRALKPGQSRAQAEMGSGAEAERTRVAPPWPEDVRIGEPPWIPVGRTKHHDDLVPCRDVDAAEHAGDLPPAAGLLDRRVVTQHLLDEVAGADRSRPQSVSADLVVKQNPQAIAEQ